MLGDSITESDIDKVIDILRDKLGVNSDRALAMELGLSHSGISMSKKKGTLPYTSIVATCKKKKISLDEVFGIDVDQTSDSSSTEEKPTKSEDV
ncbi:helix-turn-helix domain-containing protein, partial [Pseudoalteromonas luteoviolacea]|uniref:helix-turn-helix domain-containing protein n=1 Tax=Pseudoalteromonas luteoviolacea TaxID=43657 RepID=UPI001B38E53C